MSVWKCNSTSCKDNKNAIACYDKVFPYTEMIVCIYVDFAGGLYRSSRAGVPLCYESQKLCIWIISSAQRGSTLGPPHKTAHVPNPSRSSISASLYSFLWLWWQQVTSCDKLTASQKDREQWKSLTLFVSHTVKYAHTNGQIAWKCVSVWGAKMVLSLFFSRAGRDWWQEDYWSSRRWNQDKEDLWIRPLKP